MCHMTVVAVTPIPAAFVGDVVRVLAVGQDQDRDLLDFTMLASSAPAIGTELSVEIRQ